MQLFFDSVLSMGKKLKLSHLRAWDAYMKSHSETLKRIQKDIESSMSMTWYEILYLVNSAPESRRRMSDLAEMLVLSKSALTRAIDALVDEGYLKRVECPSDGRVSYAQMTTLGRNKLKSTWPKFRQSLQENFGEKLTIEEAKSLEKLLRKINVKD
jgi:DNA-binding MarR family transcriptional regulator